VKEVNVAAPAGAVKDHPTVNVAAGTVKDPPTVNVITGTVKDHPVRLVVGQFQSQGMRPQMEDETLVEAKVMLKTSTTGLLRIQSPIAFAGVFDGHGGKKAAIFTKQRLFHYVVEELEKGSEPDVALKNGFLRTDTDFIAGERLTNDRSGTTACTVLLELSTGRFWVANVGDSRAVLCRAGHAFVLSIDHKADRADEVERIRKAGGFVINKRVMGELAVSRAIGDSDFKEQEVKLVIADPEIKEERASDADSFMLIACDGLYDVMTNDDCCNYISHALSTHGDINRAATDIVNHSIQTLHSRDNVSAIILRFAPPQAP